MTMRPQLISRGNNLAFLLLLYVGALAFLGTGVTAFHLVRTHWHTTNIPAVDQAVK